MTRTGPHTEWKAVTLRPTDIVTVCTACGRACCWQGEFMCDDAYSAAIRDETVARLRSQNLAIVYLTNPS